MGVFYWKPDINFPLWVGLCQHTPSHSLCSYAAMAQDSPWEPVRNTGSQPTPAILSQSPHFIKMPGWVEGIVKMEQHRLKLTYIWDLFPPTFKVKLLSLLRLSVIPLTVAYQAPPSTAFSRQEYWSGLPFPSPGDLSEPGIKPRSSALQADALPSEPPGKPPFKGKVKLLSIPNPEPKMLSNPCFCFHFPKAPRELFST